MIDRVLYLLAAVVQAVKRWLRTQEQEAAQHERDKISKDPAQHSADKFGDGRVQSLSEYADKTNGTERTDDYQR